MADFQKSLSETPRYGKAKIVTLRADVDDLREAIRAEGTPAIQDAWEKAERWVDRVFTTDQEGTGT